MTCPFKGMKFIGKQTKVNILHNYSMNSTAQLIRKSATLADLAISPEVESIDSLDFWKGEEAIKAGELAVEENIEEIKKLVAFWR